MSGLRDYLSRKRSAYNTLRSRIDDSTIEPRVLSSRVHVETGTGVRIIKIRHHQVISDSRPEFAGHDLGPSSLELQTGVIGSCISHIFMVQAARLDIPLEAVEVEVSCEINLRAGTEGHENVPIYPHNFQYTAHITSSASDKQINELFVRVERACPILHFLVNPQTVVGRVNHITPAPRPATSAALDPA